MADAIRKRIFSEFPWLQDHHVQEYDGNRMSIMQWYDKERGLSQRIGLLLPEMPEIDDGEETGDIYSFAALAIANVLSNGIFGRRHS